ncbi:hypothetical protein G7Y89_g2388 [Cudoniella acicularis]|uniref:Uncharacterized protein n=1 Tax=Cudoniella acicularis TaxID=354080 RepID=A0A8H4RU81_9HELO|nr:hypothetical protein G7Y89_g2388 [Cudoniella acicularis]
MVSHARETAAATFQASEEIALSFPNLTSDLQASLVFVLSRSFPQTNGTSSESTFYSIPFLESIYLIFSRAFCIFRQVFENVQWLLVLLDCILRWSPGLLNPNTINGSDSLIDLPISDMLTKLPIVKNLISRLNTALDISQELTFSPPIKVRLLPSTGEFPSLVRLQMIGTPTRLSPDASNAHRIRKLAPINLDSVPDTRSFWGNTSWPSYRRGALTAYDNPEMRESNMNGKYFVLYSNSRDESSLPENKFFSRKWKASCARRYSISEGRRVEEYLRQRKIF